ncbi:hypothetical protein F5B22DRAFT_645994 [Xylaria bambusicola]|uniref:uncharacterized protein n=1 Tax=Xylaria bambusicola TaxID=326684 RepID=UPI002008303E|nr:uncharacterized protein F5B22DRAFT_645994 [Xylaria bambusicola]KAI0517358.1 hypothetical protein F5B22DRAFT_645994 [Xylaria bambusicola]
MSTSRRRQNSTVSSSSRALPLHTRQKSKANPAPKSAHVADPFLQSFLGPTFNPAEYLNSTLPSLQTSSRNNDPSSVPLTELSAQTQAQLSQLNAHTTRLTNTLTQLTDDILRNGSRLAYEVELLRGETLGLSEALTDTLQDDIVKFVPGGLQEQVPETKGANAGLSRSASTSQRRTSGTITMPPSITPAEETPPTATTDDVAKNVTDPAFISQLQTLTLVRSRLDTVVKTFGDAMEFVFPPSELSVSSSFLSVSAPEPGSQDRSTEEKGQKVLKELREEISSLLNSGSEPVEGIEKAARRIEELKELTTVWKGTAEEKGRTKFIDSLAKMVEDRHRDLMREIEQAGRREGATDGDVGHKRSTTGSLDVTSESRGFGIMSQLQRLRTGL